METEPAESEGAVVSGEELVERLRSVGLQARWVSGVPETLAGVVEDSRHVGDGDLFCAVAGDRHDGHEFLDEAEGEGASAAVVERHVEGSSLPQLVVSDSRGALAHLAALFHGDPAASLEVLGVTGTNGKTTTVWLLRHVLAEDGPAAAVGTLGVVGPDGERAPADLTTPTPVELHRTLGALRDRGVRLVAMEVSSHALDQRRVDGVPFRGMIFTNLSREHLDYHPSMEAYRAAKLRAAELVVSDGFLAINADEPAWEGLEPGERKVVTYGLGEGADVRARGVETSPGGSRWDLVSGDAAAAVELPLPGAYNVYNALGVAAAALRAGLDPDTVARRLSGAPQVPGRMEVLSRAPCLVVRDYAHTPDALERSLATIRRGSGRLLVVFGCGGERDRGKRPLMGRVAAKAADLAIVTTDNPRSEDPAEIAGEVVSGLDPASYEIVLDRREAIARALELAEPEDVVLLAGKGHEEYQIVGDTREPFDEARIVRELTGAGCTA